MLRSFVVNEHMITKESKNKANTMDAVTIKKGTKAKGFFIVINDKGLHTRPSTELVKCATNFKAQVNLIYQDLVVNAKSLLGILTLAATRGSRIRIEAEGEDAPEAVQEIIELARNKFYIHY
ncbi:MAG: HPr family phosphocarrier protein [Chlamydiales bacterium]|nr:HPr family phosphocarrier protein [Chlamydiales bacterium]